MSFAVPAIGLAMAWDHHLFDQAWVQVSLFLFLAGAAVLFGIVVPRQRRVLSTGHIGPRDLSVLRGSTGTWALSWVTIVVLMVAKPW